MNAKHYPEYPAIKEWPGFWHAVCAHPKKHIGSNTRVLLEHMGQGKGLRSRKVYEIARSFGMPTQDHVVFSAALEYIHTASLCHDDVMDQGTKRRNNICLHRTHTGSHAILLGDALVAEGLGLLSHLPSSGLISLACQCLAELVEGQISEYHIHECSSQHAYLSMISKKTGALFALTYQGSGLISGLAHHQMHTLSKAGYDMGIAYQLNDDCNEYEEPVEQWDDGHDCLQKKWTLPLLYTKEQNPGPLHHTLQTIWNNPHDLQARSTLVNILRPAIDFVRQMARQYASRSDHSMQNIIHTGLQP